MNHVTVCADIATNWTYINEICGVSYSVRIIGGINAKLGEYPWIALIGIRSKLLSLIDEETTFSCRLSCKMTINNGIKEEKKRHNFFSLFSFLLLHLLTQTLQQ